MVIDLNQREWFPRKRIQATICSASRSLPHGPLAAGFFNLRGIGVPVPNKVLSARGRVTNHVTKLRYDARASISFADNWLAIPRHWGADAPGRSSSRAQWLSL